MPNGFCMTCKKMTKTYELDHHIFLNESHWEHESEDDDCDFHHPELNSSLPSVRIGSVNDVYKNPLENQATIIPNKPRIGDGPVTTGPARVSSAGADSDNAVNKPETAGHVSINKGLVIIVGTLLIIYALICCSGILH